MRITWLLLVLLYTIDPLHGYERITSFISTITVHTDATIDVQESIEVMSEHQQIKHGIVREFPTQYRDAHGNNYVVDFTIQSITHDGNFVPYSVESIANGKKIYIGDKDFFVSKGKNRYVIQYRTNRQLGYFKKYDELYWNVTGTGWRLPIDKVVAHVHLPQGITQNQITAQAYTGYQDEQGNNYDCSIDNNSVMFSTKYPLNLYQGLTIVAAFPKGFVQEPSNYQKTSWFFQDNFLLLLLILCGFFFVIFVIVGVITARRMNKPGILMSLFYPPTGMFPCEVGYLNKMQFDIMLLSADIVHLAVRNFITITYKKNMFYGGTYSLTIKDSIQTIKNDLKIQKYDKDLLLALFDTKETIVLSQENSKIMQAALKICKKRTQKNCDSYLTKLHNFLYGSGLLIFLFVCCLFFWMSSVNILHLHGSLISIVVFITLFSLYFLEKIFLIYTPAGRKKQDAIDGFALYLTMAEISRMDIMGTPPTKTPELYEKYLPYAIALGIEKQWTDQFAAVFKQFEIEKGHVYHPIWYHGKSFKHDNFRSDFSGSVTNAIAAASMRPGSSSGSFGKGRSGGGGGGGGGGGW